MSTIVNAAELNQALARLNAGDVVAMPTETVYGLAARIDRDDGLRRIFSVKQRPFFDPLIVHVESVAMARGYARDWSPVAETLAAAFWPGPLTLVVPKSELISDVITSGLDSVGLRAPDHPVALELIRAAGVPLAAPSANRFGRTSPSTWEHVYEEFGDEVLILRDVPAKVGIESTVVKVDGGKLSLLRPGMITRGQITEALVKAGIDADWTAEVTRAVAPGQMKHHYMPQIPLVIAPPAMTEGEITRLLNERRHELPMSVEGVTLSLRQPATDYGRGAELILPDDPEMAARTLYSELRRVAESGAEFMYYRAETRRQGERWEAILERLTKAASLSLL